MFLKSRFVISLVWLAILLVACSERQAQPSFTSSDIPTVSPTAAAGSVNEVRPELEKYFQDHSGSFEVYDLNRDLTISYNPERCAEGFLPASTFKILNSLIGLETGVIPDENYVIQWDGTIYQVPSWNQDHNLKTAIQNSVVWYYQELARRVGSEKMQQYVEAAEYGNRDISGKIDSFWLDGGLRISADDQVEFLKRLYQGDLPFSQEVIDKVKELIILEKTDSYQLSGKTGSVQRQAVHQAWFVGYLETKGNVYFFATNFEDSNPDGFASGDNARKISVDLLRALGFLP